MTLLLTNLAHTCYRISSNIDKGINGAQRSELINNNENRQLNHDQIWTYLENTTSWVHKIHEQYYPRSYSLQ